MPKSREQKQEILNTLEENLARQKAIVFVDYKGLKVGEITELRKLLTQVGSRLVVAKKTLLAKAMKEKGLPDGRQGIEVNLKSMEGQVGAIFAYEDPVTPLKTAFAFGKKSAKVTILGGYFENEMQSASHMTALATLPSREELLAKLAGTMAAPVSGFATVLQGNIKGLITVLSRRSQTSNSTV